MHMRIYRVYLNFGSDQLNRNANDLDLTLLWGLTLAGIITLYFQTRFLKHVLASTPTLNTSLCIGQNTLIAISEKLLTWYILCN